MKEETNLISELWDYLNQPNLSKIETKVFDWLNRDNLNSIITDGKIFYFEKTCYYTIMPNYIYNWLKKWVSKKYNLIYLYDLK